MRNSIISLLLFSFALALATAAYAQEPTKGDDVASTELSTTATGPHIRVSLLNETTALVPGETTYLGVLLQPEKDWHTYWQNPGDSGEAPALDWQVSSSEQHAQWLQFGDVLWPIPKAIPVAHLVNYGYEGDNLLIVPVNVANKALVGEELQITLNLSWLVCKEDCIPGWATLNLSLPVAPNTALSSSSSVFDQARKLVPTEEVQRGSFEVTQAHVVVEITELVKDNWTLFPTQNYLIDHAAEQQWVFASDNNENLKAGSTARVLVPRSAYFDGQATELRWLVSNGNEAFYLDSTLNQGTAEGSPATHRAVSLVALLTYLGMAFLGGLILNLMPCVLPILSMKAMALQHTEQAGSHKLAYLFGVLACFNLFAVIVVALQQSGQQIGWGFHMQEPIVVALLAFLFAFIALVLFDALHVTSRFSGVGQSLVSGDSAKSHFSTGALAVIVASPCTAPFMAAALGIAFVSPVYVTFLIFNALAIGFALPVTLLFMSTKVRKSLPKPGAWMETFKHFLGFPMLATVAWLVWVYAGQAGTQAQFLLLLSLITFCMFLWLLSKTKGKVSSGLLLIGVLLSVLGPLYISMKANGQENGNTVNSGKSSFALAFDPQELASLRNQQQLVLVNMTADWCITCKVNEQVALSNSEVIAALSQEGVHYMVGDWTNKNQEILHFLSQYERAGVPLYVMYAGTKNEQVLPQILSPNMVIEAVNQAKKEIQK